MSIEEFVIHRIDKEQRSDPVVHLRNKALVPSDPRVMKFVERAIEVFKENEERPSCVFADFSDNLAAYPFSGWALECFSGAKRFLQFTKDCTNRLAACMKPQPLSTGGYVIFGMLKEMASMRLLVVMLHPQDGLSITENLELEDVTHLELKHIDKAGLVNGPVNGKFGDKPLTYAGFRKQMSQYFQEFLGPDAFRNPNKDSRQLIQAIDDYAAENTFDASELDEVRVKLRKYASDCTAEGVEMSLDTISAMVHPVKPQAFRLYATGKKLSAVIKPDNGVFKRWKVIRHKSDDGLVIQFKAESVGVPGSNRRLIFNEAQRALTINNVEEALVNKIKAAHG